MIATPVKPSDEKWKTFYRALVVVAGLLLVASIYFVYWVNFLHPDSAALTAPMLLGPRETMDFDRFKYLQDVSSKVWLAAVTVLLMLYFDKDLKL
jgi:hypothetical protein